MIFPRSVPRRKYRAYESYREQLRRDFRYRCAYCLTLEGHNGGAANYCIDHFRPRGGSFGHPDLTNEYANLYWCCRECNEIKGDAWPDQELQAQGFRFLDPCRPEDDHDLHWRVHPDGFLEPFTPPGGFTIEYLRLNRPTLVYRRQQIMAFWQAAEEIELSLRQPLSPTERKILEDHLRDLRIWLEPPIF